MSNLDLVSVIVCTAAAFGWTTHRFLRLPASIGTMLLTIAASLASLTVGAYVPGLHLWALGLVAQIDFYGLLMHGMLPLLLFAGSFLLDIKELFEQRLLVSVLSIAGTLA